MTARKRRREPAAPFEASATIAAWLILFAGLFVFGHTVYVRLWSSEPIARAAGAAQADPQSSDPDRPRLRANALATPVPALQPRESPVVPRVDGKPPDLLTTATPRTVVPSQPKQGPMTARRLGSGGRIAIIIDDLGADLDSAERLSRLPYRLSFAVLPHLAQSRRVADLLNARGFEIMLHLPMEPVDYPRDDPGTGAILLRMPAEEIRTTVRQDLAAVPHIRGVNNHMGSRITSSPGPMRTVLEILRDTPYFFIDSRTIETSIALDLARELNIPSAARSVFLDSDNAVDAIRKQVRLLERVVQAEGQAIAIGHPYPATLQVLREQLPVLTQNGFELVFASELVQ